MTKDRVFISAWSLVSAHVVVASRFVHEILGLRAPDEFDYVASFVDIVESFRIRCMSYLSLDTLQPC